MKMGINTYLYILLQVLLVKFDQIRCLGFKSHPHQNFLVIKFKCIVFLFLQVVCNWVDGSRAKSEVIERSCFLLQRSWILLQQVWHVGSHLKFNWEAFHKMFGYGVFPKQNGQNMREIGYKLLYEICEENSHLTSRKIQQKLRAKH